MLCSNVGCEQGRANQRPGQTAISQKKTGAVRGRFFPDSKVQPQKDAGAQDDKTNGPVDSDRGKKTLVGFPDNCVA